LAGRRGARAQILAKEVAIAAGGTLIGVLIGIRIRTGIAIVFVVVYLVRFQRWHFVVCICVF